MPSNLKQLFEKYNIQGLSTDSRTVKENKAFFALKGQHVDGNNFIKDVLNKGIKLIITDNEKSVTLDSSKIIYVENILATLYAAIEILYPKKPKNLIAVTGTNGKSSVVSYIAQIYSLLGKKAASIGTLGVEVFGSNISLKDIPELTTLDYLSFRKIAYKLAENGIEYLAFEASSHGLDQQRLGDLKVKIACFTSFSQDHLDYHNTKEDYLLAKLKLFTDHLSQDGIAILNSDIKEIEFIKDHLAKHNIKFITVGEKGDLNIIRINSSLKGQNVSFIFNDKEYNFVTPIIGSYQASNLLIAALSVYNTSFHLDEIISVLTEVKPVKGRMERITNTIVKSFDYSIFVDYSHTPDALEKALTELKNIKLHDSKLSVVFGCGGNRDTTKRKLMGQIASRIADNVIVTDDNPRYEDPKLIREEIISGIDKANYIEIAARDDAIKYGIDNLKQDDILLIAGKGHENYQIIGDKKLPFDDAAIARKYIRYTS